MNDPILNLYGDPATHYDCLEYHTGKCQGDMEWSENINTGRSHLRCAHHAAKAFERQQRIQRQYLNDTVSEEQ